MTTFTSPQLVVQKRITVPAQTLEIIAPPNPPANLYISKLIMSQFGAAANQTTYCTLDGVYSIVPSTTNSQNMLQLLWFFQFGPTIPALVIDFNPALRIFTGQPATLKFNQAIANVFWSGSIIGYYGE